MNKLAVARRALASMPAAEYLKIFKSRSGAELRQLIASALQFARVSNATPEMDEITRRAKEALRTIGSELSINALRVSRLGIIVPSASEPPRDGSKTG